MAVFDMDDGYLAGPPDVVFSTETELARSMRQRCGVHLNVSKCQSWSPTQGLVRTALDAHPDTPFQLGAVPGWIRGPGRGVVVSGVPVGDAHFIEFHVQAKVIAVLRQTTKIESSLRHVSPQNLYALLVYCANTRVQYMSQCLHPARTRHAFKRFDFHIAKIVDDLTGTRVFNPDEDDFPTTT